MIPKIERQDLQLGPFPSVHMREPIKRQVLLRDFIRNLNKRLKKMPPIEMEENAIINIDGTVTGFAQARDEDDEDDEEDGDDDAKDDDKEEDEDDGGKKPKVTELSVGSVAAILCFFHQSEIPKGLVKKINLAYSKLGPLLRDCAAAFKELADLRMQAVILIEQAKACTCSVVSGRMNKCMSCRVAEQKLGQSVSVFLSAKDIATVAIGRQEYKNREPTKALRSIRKKIKAAIKKHNKAAKKLEETAFKACIFNRKPGEDPIAALNGHWQHSSHEFTCVCCLSHFKDEQMITKLKCGHIFHDTCMQAFAAECYNYCPICFDPLTFEKTLFADPKEEADSDGNGTSDEDE